MNVRYSLGDYTLKVLGCDKSLDVLDFYYRNRNDFDIYESDKPEAFYTEEFIKNMLNAENKALMSLHFVRFFLVSAACVSRRWQPLSPPRAHTPPC